MFEKISNNKFKCVIVLKYIAQLFVVPLIFGLVFLIIAFMLEIFIVGFYNAIDAIFLAKVHLSGDLYFPMWSLYILFMYFINLLNILSILPFCKLILDCILKNSEKTKEIELFNELPAYELQCIRESKRFICDTFSRKKNAELFIYDENKTKYRLFWNENYGSYEKAEQIICDGKKLKISYFKRSKIIFRCELIE